MLLKMDGERKIMNKVFHENHSVRETTHSFQEGGDVHLRGFLAVLGVGHYVR